ncbi:MAG: DNA polymerase III subunit delta [Desulfobulbaceae bacterium]|nr:DNA polymerase III subunit delta [Desulfobulbaceae bacterium]
MAVFTRDQLDAMLEKMQHTDPPQVYLLFGERYLCRQAADRLCEKLLVDGGNCHLVDGEAEEFSTTLNRLASYSLFPGRQVYRVGDTKLFHSVKVAGSLWKKAVQGRQENDREKTARYLKAMIESAGLQASDPENDPGSLSAAQWKKLFGFARPPEDLAWTKALLAEDPDESPATMPAPVDDTAALLEKTLTTGIPGKNHLVLLAEDVDKRKRLYKYLAEHQVIIDLSVESGSSSKAQTARNSILADLLGKTLAGFDKTIAPQAAELLFERVGFHPVAVVLEAEKLALYVGSRRKIDVEDLNDMVGRTRQEAVYELTDALGKRDLEKSLLIAGRLVDNGIHPLAVIATLKNYTRNLLLFKALQGRRDIDYSPSMQPGFFQKKVLPMLKQDTPWTRELSGHPYALFMQFKTAAGFTLATLQKWMEQILQADFRLKGSPIEPETIIQHLLIAMLTNGNPGGLQKNN